MSLSDSELPNFGDRYLQYFNPERQQFELRRKTTNEGYLGISEAMELVERLMRRHQLSFVPNKKDTSLVLFPFAFIQPEEGDQIINNATSEIYTVDQVILNPDTNQWNGLVKLDLVSPPSIEQRHWLSYRDPTRYIRFEHEYPDALLNNPSANSEGTVATPPPIVPTVTWSLKVKEPAGYGKPFDSRKELKPRLRESTKDPYVPGYTVEIWGQSFDNVVQFDAWTSGFKLSERLLTWMEQFMKLYADFIRRQGIQNMFFWRRPEETQVNTWRQQMPVKSSQFYFRTEEIEARYLRDILKIDLSLGAEEVIPYDDKYRYIAGQRVSGAFTPDEYRALFYRSGEYLFGELDIRQ